LDRVAVGGTAERWSGEFDVPGLRIDTSPEWARIQRKGWA
jgi:hypothetical protein